MCDTTWRNIRSDHCDSVEKSENTNVEDMKPVPEEITTIKTEVIEEFYGHRASDGVELENTNAEYMIPVYEEITTMKTEVIEECYDYGTLSSVKAEDGKSFSMSECSQSVSDEHAAAPAYKETLKKDCYEQYIVWCKEENGFGLGEEGVAAQVVKKYACDKCSYITKNRPNFRRHTLVHKKTFKCETCGRSFQRKDALQKHTKMHETKQYVCELCGYVTKNKAHFQNHAVVHGNKREFSCATCGSSFKRKDGLWAHVKIHGNERQKKLCCPHCSKSYYTNVALQTHIDVKHACRRYECRLCGYTTGYKHDLKRHELSKHDNGDKLYKCKYCEHTTHYKMHLEKHECTHSNARLLKCNYKNCTCEQQYIPNEEKPCDCDPCQFETITRNNLRKHIIVKHSSKAVRHSCTICTYSTYIAGCLRRHMYCTHINKRSPDKYKCEHCDHVTNCKGNLRKHTLMHTNEKIFKCTYINCKCAQRYDCVGEKPCDCEPCGYETVFSRGLKRHISTKHSGEAKKQACQYCDFSTHSKRRLTRHLLCKHANTNSVPPKIGAFDNETT